MASSEAAILDLGHQLTIAEVEQVQLKIEALLAASTHLSIDAAEIGKVDTAGLQLLCSVKKTFRNTEGGLYWKDISPSLMKSACLLGVDAYLELV
jgi:anti-anti-sigma regulatory factor